MNEEHVFDQIPAYALGILEPDEMRLVENHLPHCLRCSEELKVYQAVVNGLALSPVQVEPPDRLKQSILQAARAGEPASPANWSTDSPRPAPVRRKVSLSWVKPFLPAWGIASLVLILVLCATNLFLWQQVQKASQSGTLHVSDFQIVQMNGTTNAPQATGIIVISQNGMAGSLNVDGLPPLDSHHQYQLWLNDHGTRSSGGVFSVDQQGYGALKVNSMRPLIDYNTFGITIEPTGGSPGPTGAKVLGGNL